MTVTDKLNDVTNFGDFYDYDGNYKEGRLIIAGNIAVCSPYMGFPYSAIITAVGGGLSVLAAVYIFMAEICTCPCRKLFASCGKGCGTRGCAKICTVHVEKQNGSDDSEKQKLIDAEQGVDGRGDEQDPVFQCCTYRIIYSNNRKTDPVVHT